MLDRTPLTREERRQIIREITDDILGYGPLETFLRDDSVTEVMVNAYDQIYVERLGKLEPEAERMAGFIVDETDRLSRTVARYLQFARAEEGTGDAAAPGDAGAALRATLDLLDDECRARKVVVGNPARVLRDVPQEELLP